nr:NAD(P)/FAD-dependent oxidoreductase [Thermoleophilaceae bacterium]
AQAFARLGSQVTVYEKQDRLLGSEEPEAGAAVLASLRADGLDVRLGADASDIDADLVLLAAGRRPALDEIDGLVLDDDGYVKTDTRMRTSRSEVYAAGDITGGVQYTHSAAQEGMVAGANAAGGRARVSERVIPRVTFTDPEVASVGLTEAAARGRYGKRVEVAVLPMSAVDRAKILGRTEGFMKLVVHRRGPLGRATGGRLLGAHVVGEGAGEMIHEAVLVMQSRAFAGRLAQAIHAYPTASVGMQQTAALLFPQGRAQVPGAQKLP